MEESTALAEVAEATPESVMGAVADALAAVALLERPTATCAEGWYESGSNENCLHRYGPENEKKEEGKPTGH